MSEATIDALLEQIASLEQKVAHRDLLLERIQIWLTNQPFDPQAREFLASIEKHLGILQSVEGAREIHLQDGVELSDKET